MTEHPGCWLSERPALQHASGQRVSVKHPPRPCKQEVFTLPAWFADVLARHDQVARWTAGDVRRPPSIWLPGLFNRELGQTKPLKLHRHIHLLFCGPSTPAHLPTCPLTLQPRRA